MGDRRPGGIVGAVFQDKVIAARAAMIGQCPAVGKVLVLRCDFASLGQIVERAPRWHMSENQRDVVARWNGAQANF